MKLINIHTGELWEPALVQGGKAYRSDQLTQSGKPDVRRRVKRIGLTFLGTELPATKSYLITGTWVEFDEATEKVTEPLRARIAELQAHADALRLTVLNIYLKAQQDKAKAQPGPMCGGDTPILPGTRNDCH